MTEFIRTAEFTSSASMELFIAFENIKRADIVAITTDGGRQMLTYIDHIYTREEKRQMKAEKKRIKAEKKRLKIERKKARKIGYTSFL